MKIKEIKLKGYNDSYLSFNLGKETFAVKLVDIVEVFSDKKITFFSANSNFLIGEINLNKVNIPVIDVRNKLLVTPPQGYK